MAWARRALGAEPRQGRRCYSSWRLAWLRLAWLPAVGGALVLPLLAAPVGGAVAARPPTPAAPPPPLPHRDPTGGIRSTIAALAPSGSSIRPGSTLVERATMAATAEAAKAPLRAGQSVAVGARAPRAARVTFLGDSITAWGDWRRRFPDGAITNAGHPGDTSLDLLARLDPVRAGRPDLVLLMVGINDLLRGARVEAVAERVIRIRDLLAASGRVRVILQSTLACQASRCGTAQVARVRQLNRLLRAGVAADDFLDVDAALSDATGLRPAYSLDGLHLTPAGYSRWQELLRSRLGSQLGRSLPMP